MRTQADGVLHLAMNFVGRIFAGSSVLFSMRRGFGMPKILGVMGRREEGTRYWSVSIRQ